MPTPAPRERIPIAADHAGYEMKQKLEQVLDRMGDDVQDLGPNAEVSPDYPDFPPPPAKEISEGDARRGILLCGTGLGMSYVANRYPHVRAAVVWSPEIAKL